MLVCPHLDGGLTCTLREELCCLRVIKTNADMSSAVGKDRQVAVFVIVFELVDILQNDSDIEATRTDSCELFIKSWDCADVRELVQQKIDRNLTLASRTGIRVVNKILEQEREEKR